MAARKYSEEDIKLHSKRMKEWWENLSTEQKALISARRSVGAKRMWAKRGARERRKIGESISATRKAKKSE